MEDHRRRRNFRFNGLRRKSMMVLEELRKRSLRLRQSQSYLFFQHLGGNSLAGVSSSPSLSPEQATLPSYTRISHSRVQTVGGYVVGEANTKKISADQRKKAVTVASAAGAMASARAKRAERGCNMADRGNHKGKDTRDQGEKAVPPATVEEDKIMTLSMFAHYFL
ncbi:hypothetical protein HPP92_026287 [Vanilla planifolia]|uniref:Uncharacterized protein n=1 Tax=Vanilla planifolia TaxID=51239 RepID=A0A835PNH2_VANPL|nr:hypothetical protein HPP92_026287 [Vanilla planifolia]KAG0455655.1 hypothetical protein HPP92_024947 [Vanilla planifolia]